MRLLSRLIEVAAHFVGHAVEPLVHRARQLPVPGHADLGQRLEPDAHFAELRVVPGTVTLPPNDEHDQNDRKCKQRKDGQACERKQDMDGIERDAPHLKGL